MLKVKRRKVMNMSSPDFESIKHLNPYAVEYWEARELQPLLGYQSSWQNFEKVIKKAMVSCEATGNIIDDHFNGAIKPIVGGKGAVQNTKDYYLSRLACYLIAMNGDPRKQTIAQAQQYFAVSTRKNEMHEIRQEYQERVQIRLEVAEGNRQLSEAAARAGVRSPMFGVFHDAGYLGQYALDAENIRLYKGIPEGGEILDYMGREELASNLFRITQMEGRLRREQIVGEDAAIQAHFAVGREVRDTLKRLGATMPEDLPTADSIRTELERQRRARQKILRDKKQQEGQEPLL
jgi:DNA-damage-inducible protein D